MHNRRASEILDVGGCSASGLDRSRSSNVNTIEYVRARPRKILHIIECCGRRSWWYRPEWPRYIPARSWDKSRSKCLAGSEIDCDRNIKIPFATFCARVFDVFAAWTSSGAPMSIAASVPASRRYPATAPSPTRNEPATLATRRPSSNIPILVMKPPSPKICSEYCF